MSQPGSLTEVTSITVGPFQENTFFLRASSSSEVIVIDPGDEAPRLIEFLESRNLRPVAIVNTHAHLDHVGAIQPLKEHFKIPSLLNKLLSLADKGLSKINGLSPGFYRLWRRRV